MKRYVAKYMSERGIDDAALSAEGRARVRREAFKQWRSRIRRRPGWVKHITKHPAAWEPGDLAMRAASRRNKERSKQTARNEFRHWSRTDLRADPVAFLLTTTPMYQGKVEIP